MMVPKEFVLNQAACEKTTEHVVWCDPKWAGLSTADEIGNLKPLTPITVVSACHGAVNILSGHLEPRTTNLVAVVGSAPNCTPRREQIVTVLRYSQVFIWGLEMDEVPVD